MIERERGREEQRKTEGERERKERTKRGIEGGRNR